MNDTMTPPPIPLTEEKMEKVCLITDINKITKFLENRDISPREFDMLYDAPKHVIQNTYDNLRHTYAMKRATLM